jgi:EpsI family protein
MVPPAFGRWRVDATSPQQLVSPDVAEKVRAIYDQVLNRTYVDPAGRRIMLAIAYGSSQTQQLKAHRQEVCYSAQGFEVHDIQKAGLSLNGIKIDATRLVAIQGARQEPITYWFTMGNQVVLTRTQRLVTQLRYALAGVIPDGFLVRISSIDNDAMHAYQLHEEFANDLALSLEPAAREKLLGDLR